MTKKKPVVHEFPIHPYSARLYFTTCEKLYTKLRGEYTEHRMDLSGAVGCSSDFQGGAVQLVGVFDGSMNTLAHEIGHMVIKVLESRGVPINGDNSEAFCYLLGHTVGELAPILQGTTK